jgi:hypothetical protein
MSESLVPTVATAQVAVQGEIRTAVELLEAANTLTITTPGHRVEAGLFVQNVKGVGKRIEEARVKFTGPLNTVLREINLIFKKPILDIENAEAISKEKCLAWDRQVKAEQDRLRREAEERARKEQERLDREAEAKARKAEAQGKLERAEEIRQTVPQVVIQTPLLPEPEKVAGESTRTLYRARVTNEAEFYMGIASGIIPLHMATPNLTELNKAATAMKKALQWPGVEVVEVESLGVRAR